MKNMYFRKKLFTILLVVLTFCLTYKEVKSQSCQIIQPNHNIGKIEKLLEIINKNSLSKLEKVIHIRQTSTHIAFRVTNPFTGKKITYFIPKSDIDLVTPTIHIGELLSVVVYSFYSYIDSGFLTVQSIQRAGSYIPQIIEAAKKDAPYLENWDDESIMNEYVIESLESIYNSLAVDVTDWGDTNLAKKFKEILDITFIDNNGQETKELPKDLPTSIFDLNTKYPNTFTMKIKYPHTLQTNTPIITQLELYKLFNDNQTKPHDAGLLINSQIDKNTQINYQYTQDPNIVDVGLLVTRTKDDEVQISNFDLRRSSKNAFDKYLHENNLNLPTQEELKASILNQLAEEIKTSNSNDKFLNSILSPLVSRMLKSSFLSEIKHKINVQNFIKQEILPQLLNIYAFELINPLPSRIIKDKKDIVPVLPKEDDQDKITLYTSEGETTISNEDLQMIKNTFEQFFTTVTVTLQKDKDTSIKVMDIMYPFDFDMDTLNAKELNSSLFNLDGKREPRLPIKLKQEPKVLVSKEILDKLFPHSPIDTNYTFNRKNKGPRLHLHTNYEIDTSIHLYFDKFTEEWDKLEPEIQKQIANRLITEVLQKGNFGSSRIFAKAGFENIGELKFDDFPSPIGVIFMLKFFSLNHYARLDIELLAITHKHLDTVKDFESFLNDVNIHPGINFKELISLLYPQPNPYYYR